MRWLILIPLSLCALAGAGQVQLRDGQVIQGTVRIADAGVLITPADGKPQSFSLDQLQRVQFADNDQASPPPPAASAGGLLGEYFADQTLARRLFTRIDPAIRFNWTHDTPHPLLPAAFSVRWTGEVEADFSEDYTFITSADDGVRLWIDGTLIIDDWKIHEAADRSGSFALQARHRHTIELEYFNHAGRAAVSLSWQSAHTPRQIIPPSHLHPATPQPSSPASAHLRIPMPSFDGGAQLVRTIDAPLHPSRGSYPAIAITRPAEAATLRAPATLKIRVAVNAPGAPVARVRFYDDETPIAEVTQPPYEFEWPHPRPGNHCLLAEVIDANELSGVSDPVEIRIAGDGRGTFPAPWAEQTIRQRERERPTPAPGHASFADGAFLLRSPPGDLLTAESDYAHFVYVPLDGDGQIIAHLARLQTSDSGMHPLAGLMIRDAIRPEARRAALLASKDRLVLSIRDQLGAMPRLIDKFNIPLQWLRLLRYGQQIRVYSSADGRSWSLLASQEVPLGRSTLIGLTLFSTDPVAHTSATLDHVRVIPGSPEMDATVPGFQMRDGMFIPADVTALDDASLLYRRNGADQRIAINDVARVNFAPLLHELAASAGHNPGVLLRSGDLVQGEVKSIRDGRVRTSDVLFGARWFEIDRQVTAVFLKPADLSQARCLLTLSDGSVYPARRFDLEDDQIIIETPRQGEFRFSQSMLRELRIPAR